MTILNDDNTLYCSVRSTDLAVERCQEFQFAKVCDCVAGRETVAEWLERTRPATEKNGPPPEAPRAHDLDGDRICKKCNETKIPSNWKTDFCRNCARVEKGGKAEGTPKKPRATPGDTEGGEVEIYTHYAHGDVAVSEGNGWVTVEVSGDEEQDINMTADQVESLARILSAMVKR